MYVVAQPGAGVARLLEEFSVRRPAASLSFVPQLDRLSAGEHANYLNSIAPPEAPNLLVAAASDPSFPQPFAGARPGELCLVTDDDLALGQADIVELFAINGVEIGNHAARTLFEITGGWTAGVAYALRLWLEHGEATACDPGAPLYHSLRVYVHERLLQRLSDDELAALVTSVAIEDGGMDALRKALPATGIEVALASLEQRRLLVRFGGKMRVPRIFAQSVREYYRRDLHALASRIAADLAQSGNHEIAARISFSAGAPERGVEYLLQVPTEDLLARRLEFQDVGKSVNDAIVCAHPVLWFATLHWRRHRVDLRVLIAEGQLLLDTFGSNPTVALLIKSALHIGYCEAGEFAYALALEDELTQARENEAFPAMARASIAGNFATALSLRGRVAEAARVLQAASRLLARSPMLLSLFMQIHVRKASLEANWFAERAFHERAIAAADESGEPTAIALALVEAAFGALVAGDREAREVFTARIRAMGFKPELAPFFAFARIGRGSTMDAAARFGLPRLRGVAHVFHAASAGSPNEARAHLTAAVEEFDGSGYVYGRVLARVALAQVLPIRQEELASQAKTIAEELGLPALRGALSHLAIGELPEHDQPLRHFARQFRKFREESQAPLDVALLEGRVEQDGRTLDVSNGVLQLFAALFVRRRPLDREELCHMLWPDMDTQAAASELKLTVRRARLQCGDTNVVTWAAGKYALGDGIRVDVERVRRLCEDALGDKCVLSVRRSELHEAYRALAKGRPACVLHHEWFMGTEAMLTRLQMSLGEALAHDLIERADFADAAEFAGFMLACDPCDETAWELVIRAHLAAGERDAAARALREYRNLVCAQLRAAPSARIERLLA